MSYRNDTEATYDRTLLSSVPDPTRAEKQEGYNVDLLDESREHRAPSPPVPNRQPTDQQPLTDGGAASRPPKEGRLENGGGAAVAKSPWYRTRWGITAIVIAIIVIIGAIVGGVVGGTHHSSSNRVTTPGGGNPSPNGGGSQNSSSPIQSQSSTNGSGSGFTQGGVSEPGAITGASVSSTFTGSSAIVTTSSFTPIVSGRSTQTSTTPVPQSAPNPAAPNTSM